MLNKKKELSQNKKNITQQIYVTRRKHDNVKRNCSHLLQVNYLLCNDDRTKKEKNRDIDLVKRSIHERNKTTKAKWNQQSDCNNEKNVEKKRNINNIHDLARVQSKDVDWARKKRRREKIEWSRNEWDH